MRSPWNAAAKQESDSMWTSITDWLLFSTPEPEHHDILSFTHISDSLQIAWNFIMDWACYLFHTANRIFIELMSSLGSGLACTYSTASELVQSSCTFFTKWIVIFYSSLLSMLQIHQFYINLVLILAVPIALIYFVHLCCKLRQKKQTHVRGTKSRPRYFAKSAGQNAQDHRTPKKIPTNHGPPRTKDVMDISSSDDDLDVETYTKSRSNAHRVSQRKELHHISPWRLQYSFATIIVAGFLCSFPWEFIRIYQKEVAKKAAVSLSGPPAECQSPQQMSTWQWLVKVIGTSFSWEQTPCKQYFEAQLVDPFWEVTPIVVICSLMTRCFLTPLEALSSGIGEGLRLLLHKVPWQWQPLVMVLAATVFTLSVAMCCRYRIILPLLVSLEPMKKTPVVVRVRPQRQEIQCAPDQHSLEQ